MEVSRFGREVDIARSRSVVKVAIPQRRGNELPISAILRSGVTSAPGQGLSIAQWLARLEQEDWPMAHLVFATRNRPDGPRDMRSKRAVHCRQPRCWCGRRQRKPP